jgi:hypothetical protein
VPESTPQIANNMSHSTNLKIWKIESLRLSVFYSAPDNVDSEKWYEKCLSVTPEKTELRRAEGIQIDTGVVDGQRCTLQVQQGRADWNLSREFALDAIEGDLGASHEAGKLFRVFFDWVAELRSVVRIAVGVVCKFPTDDKNHSYRVLQSFLPDLNIDLESSEFGYKINRPRKIDLLNSESMLINRISAWGALMQRRLVQQVIPGEIQFKVASEKSSHSVVCEVDISTDAIRTEVIDPSYRVFILERLVDLSLEIFEKGDVK